MEESEKSRESSVKGLLLQGFDAGTLGRSRGCHDGPAAADRAGVAFLGDGGRPLESTARRIKRPGRPRDLIGVAVLDRDDPQRVGPRIEVGEVGG